MNVEFAKSLGAFQREVPVIAKGSQGYGYSYADLAQIVNTIVPYLHKHNLAYTQMVQGTSLVTTIIHTETGETLEASMDIPQGIQLKGMNEYQVLGSAISYLRRYQLTAMLGIVSDMDRDAAGQQTAPSKPKLTDARFQEALKAIDAGNYTADQLKDRYYLSNEQLKKLENDGK